MIAYQTFCQLRQAWDERHLTMAQIARALSLHPQTVKKWVGRPPLRATAHGAAGEHLG